MSETFWVAVSFGVFVLLAWKPLGKALGTALGKRAEQIQKELDEATRLREEAQELLASFQRRQRDALKEAEELTARAKKEADQMLREAEAALEQTLNKRIEMAMNKIQQTEASIVQDVKTQAIDIAIATSQNIIKDHLDKAVARGLLNQALKDVQKKLH